MQRKLTAVVVTYNRKPLLQRCLSALLMQTVPLDRIFVIDNASTDGTAEMLASEPYSGDQRIEYQRLQENLGGAGGFAAGMQRACAWGADWVWIMDDDAEPEAGALAALLPYATAGVIPVSTQVDGRGRLYGAYTQVMPRCIERLLNVGFIHSESAALAFVGPLLSRESIERVGLPRIDFFIYFDDMEYSLRLRAAGYKIVLIEESKISHERLRGAVKKRFLWMTRTRTSTPGWRYYYDTRNRIVVAKEYARGSVLTILALLARLMRNTVGDILFDPTRMIDLLSYRTRGILDGVTGRLGKRVTPR